MNVNRELLALNWVVTKQVVHLSDEQDSSRIHQGLDFSDLTCDADGHVITNPESVRAKAGAQTFVIHAELRNTRRVGRTSNRANAARFRGVNVQSQFTISESWWFI